MEEVFTDLAAIFHRTQDALQEYCEILTPMIENARDDHERLFWHHIYEEEEHRSDRLDILLPKIDSVLKNGADLSNHQPEFVVNLLQDISLEKFGLHNFLEHLDLFLYQIEEAELRERVQEFRKLTDEDYQKANEILEKLNHELQGGVQFNTAIPTDEKEETDARLKIAAYSSSQPSNEQPPVNKHPRKSLTIGSLKQK